MNPSDLSPYNEITFGQSFFIVPLRGQSFRVKDCALKGDQLSYTMEPGEDEFAEHQLAFNSLITVPAEPVPSLEFLDEAGGFLAVLAVEPDFADG